MKINSGKNFHQMKEITRVLSWRYNNWNPLKSIWRIREPESKKIINSKKVPITEWQLSVAQLSE